MSNKDYYTQLQEETCLDEYRKHREPRKWVEEEGDYELKTKKK